MKKLIQAKHITTEQFLAAVRADHAEGWGTDDGTRYFHSTAYSVARRLGMPDKVVMAKIDKLNKQGVLWGSCGCGCGSPIFIAGDMEHTRRPVTANDFRLTVAR